MGYYPYGQIDSGAMAEVSGAIGIVLLVVGLVGLLGFAFSILSYVLQSLGMYTIAQRRGINHPWLAWIPYGNLWILGSISDQYQYVAQGQVKNRRKAMLGLSIAVAVLSGVCFGISVYSAIQGVVAGFNDAMYIMEDMMLPVSIGLVAVELVMCVLSVILAVLQYVCLYNLYASCEPSSKVGFLLLSIFVAVTMPFLVFASRKKDGGMPPRQPEYQPQYQPQFQPQYQYQPQYQPEYQQTYQQPEYPYQPEPQPVDPPAFEE